MNGPPVVMLLALIGLVIYFAGRYSSRRDVWPEVDEADALREKQRVEWARRQHPSNQ